MATKQAKKTEIVGTVYMAHADYGVVEIPCTQMSAKQVVATQHSPVTGYVTRLLIDKRASKSAAVGYSSTAREAEAELLKLLTEEMLAARAEAEAALRAVDAAEARLQRVKLEGARRVTHVEANRSLYTPGPSAKTDEGDEERRRDREEEEGVLEGEDVVESAAYTEGE